MRYTVYILESKKLNRFYIGYSSDLQERMTFHMNAESNKFTHRANDWVLFYKIDCDNKKQAMQVEKHIKRMKSKTYVQNLKKYPDITEKLLQKYRTDY